MKIVELSVFFIPPADHFNDEMGDDDGEEDNTQTAQMEKNQGGPVRPIDLLKTFRVILPYHQESAGIL